MARAISEIDLHGPTMGLDRAPIKPLSIASGSAIRLRRVARMAGLALVAGALAACGGFNARLPSSAPTSITEAPPPITGPVDRLGRPLDERQVQVGLLLPLSGSASDIGRAMQRAAEMAIFDFDAAHVHLVVRDSGDQAPTAATAAGQVIAEGADIILGPFFSATVDPVATAAEQAGINVIAFTTDSSKADRRNVYLFSFLPELHVERIIQYAAQSGLTRIAVVAPSTTLGNLVASSARAAAAGRSADIVATEFYDQSSGDPTAAVAAVRAAQPDAVLIADVGQGLGMIAPSLSAGGVNAQILGTGQWDTPNRGAQAALVGAWYAAPDPTLPPRVDFEQRYTSIYGAAPPRLATLAYDATALAITLSNERSSYDQPFSATALNNSSGFVGIDGIFRFGPNGLVERGLAVLEIRSDGSTVVIDPAAQSFAGPIF